MCWRPTTCLGNVLSYFAGYVKKQGKNFVHKSEHLYSATIIKKRKYFVYKCPHSYVHVDKMLWRWIRSKNIGHILLKTFILCLGCNFKIHNFIIITVTLYCQYFKLTEMGHCIALSSFIELYTMCLSCCLVPGLICLIVYSLIRWWLCSLRLQCRVTQSLWKSRSCKVYTRVMPANKSKWVT